MREILLVLILLGAGLQTSICADQQDKNSDVNKYNGPVVYTNLPPPVLYFPNFPEKPKFSNRGSSGDTEDKRVEYVPFPYKDLPLLVYQSESQPPVHVVEKNQSPEKDDMGTSRYSAGYQTGPALYRVTDNEQHESGEVGPMNQPQDQGDKYINIGLSPSQIPQIDPQNQQYISIGVTSIQPQAGDGQGQQLGYSQPVASSQQSSSTYSQMQYSSNQNADPMDYQNAEPSGQGGPAYVYYSSQYPSQNVENQAQVPVEQLTQAIKNYLIQHNSVQQQARQTLLSYPTKEQESYASPPENTPPQHVGITIIRQPPAQDDHEDDGGESQYSQPQYSQPQPQYSQSQYSQTQYSQPQYSQAQYSQPQYSPAPVQMSSNQGYDENQQYVSIGVFPINVPGQDPEQYYNLMAPVPAGDQYQSMSEDYKQVSQTHEKPPTIQNENAQTAGYQLISIDLSTLKNQNADQQGNTYSEHPKPVQKPPPATPPPKIYRPQAESENSYKTREKEFQQILIQIPDNILSKQEEKPARGKESSYNTPYTGTAQVANIIDTTKAASRPIGNVRPAYNRPPQQRPPPPVTQHSERPRNPNQAFGFPPAGMITNGINIAIIKQTDSSNNSPTYKPPENRPLSHHTQLKAPTHPIMDRIPPPPNFSQGPRRPHHYVLPKRPVSSNNPRINYEREPTYPLPTTRYQTYQHFGQYRNKPLVRNLGGHPGIYASSDLHYTTVNPALMRQSMYSSAFSMPQSMAYAHASAAKTHSHYVPSPVTVSMSSSPSGSESELQAFTDSMSNSFGEVNFDEINAFLSPSYDLFGSLTNGPKKKKVETETKLLQKVTSDLFIPHMNALGMPASMPPYNLVRPPPSIQNVPFPYKYWEQPMAQFSPPPGVMGVGDRTRLMNYYSHMQQPYTRGRPLPPLGNGKEKQRGLGKGYRGLRRKLAELRSSIRQKSKITPRLEITEDSDASVSDQVNDASKYEKATPRSTIIKSESGLDGISIPLNPNHVLSSRISTEDEENKGDKQMPPIIVYKGTKPPIEIYGSKVDIEGTHDNKTETAKTDSPDVKEEPPKSPSTDKPDEMSVQESFQGFSTPSGEDYLKFMYSMLPDFFSDTFSRRQDTVSNDKWQPVRAIEYALAEDASTANETSSEKVIPPTTLDASKDFKVSQNSSTNVESTIEENVEELVSLLGTAEKSDLVKK